MNIKGSFLIPVWKNKLRKNTDFSTKENKTFNENMTLLPADDSLDENRNGDREDGEADRQLVKEGLIPLLADTAS